MLALTACSDYDYDHSNLSDKNITFKVADVSASVETEASINGRAATGGHVVVNKAIQAAPNDYKPMYLQRYVGQTPSRTHLEGISKDSRAATTTANLTSFGLLAYRYESGNSATTPNFMYNEQVSKSGNVWSSTQQYNWPANTDKIDFYAYAPFVENGTGSGIILSSSSASGVPVIDFTMQQAAANQIDLVAAVATGKDKTNSASGVSLTFIHALTTVKFVKGDDLLGTIKSITIKNVYLSGKYTIGGTWSFTGKTATNYQPALGTSLMMIPQQFGSNALVEVVYNDGLNDYTLNYPLSTETWTAGETITYRISSEEMSSLHLGYVNFPVLKDNFPKTAYANGDEMGLYVVDDEGNIKNNNVKLTYNGTSWSAASSVIFSPQYNYYAYFPYKESGLGHSINSAKPMSRATGYTADTLSVSGFFSSGIGTWNISDQSTAEKFMAADLQIAKGFVSVGDALTLRFDMSHALGLAQFELGQTCLGTEYSLSTDANYKWGSNGVATATSSFSAASTKPYNCDLRKYLMFVKPGVETTINSVAGNADSWAEALTFTVAADTISKSQTAYSTRGPSGTATYTLALGDYLYSDGSFAHGDNMPAATEARHPIAVVFCTTPSNTDKNAGFKSGYAVAIASAGAQLRWAKSTALGATNQVQSSFKTTLAAVKSDLDGRTETQRIVKLSDFSKENYPSAYYATHFGTSEIGLTTGTGSSSSEASGGSAGYAAPTGTTVKNSGWYLGSIGQYYLVARNLGGNIDNPTTSTWQEGDLKHWCVDGVSQANKNALEAIFTKGSSSWAPSFGMPWSSNQYATWYWTSSEFSASHGFLVSWSRYGYFFLDGKSAKSSMDTHNRGVRAVIAF